MSVQTRPESTPQVIPSGPPTRRPLTARLYDVLHRWAESGWAGPAVGAWALLQSSIVPGPADAVFLPLGLADPPKVWRLAAWAAVFASIGGMLAYLIGTSATTESGQMLLATLHISEGMLRSMSGAFARYGWLLVFFGAFGPISTKLTCFAAGMLGMPPLSFALSITAGRTARFFGIAVLVHAGGERIERWLRARSGMPRAQ